MQSKNLCLQHELKKCSSVKLSLNVQKNQLDQSDEFRSGYRESSWKWGTVKCDRVARVTKGGKRYSFRYTVAVGDGAGKVGVGVSNDKEPRNARKKAVRDGRRNLIQIPLTFSKSIPHEIVGKFQSAKVLLRPLAKGDGIKAGRTARVVLQLGGITDVMAKQLGSVNGLHNAKAITVALRNIKAKHKNSKPRP